MRTVICGLISNKYVIFFLHATVAFGQAKYILFKDKSRYVRKQKTDEWTGVDLDDEESFA